MSDNGAARELTGKEAIYAQIGEFVKERTGKRIGKSGGRDIFDLVVKAVFQTATAEGTLRFNAGHGSLHLRKYQGGSRRLPGGQVTTFGERQKLRYEEGTTVRSLINGGTAVASVQDPSEDLDLD